jgi:hypothetical protein
VNSVIVRAAAAVGLVTSLLLGSVAPAAASCVMPPPIEEAVQNADLAFVGTVTGLANDGRWATVAVAEVWIGPDLPPIVEVRGGPDPGTFSSVDRAFVARTTYLFLPSISEGAIHDSSCSSTTEWTADLARLRPATARPPVGAVPEPGATDPFDPASLLMPIALIVGAGVVVFGAALLIRKA